jgi:hypothetical protein
MSHSYKGDEAGGWRQGNNWLKRKLSKIRRMVAKEEIRTGRPAHRNGKWVESECNWKGW